MAEKERYDFFEHLGGVVDGPTGNGGRTTVVGSIVTQPGRRVHLHALIPLTAFTGPLTILHGDGSTAYHANGIIAAGNPNGAFWPLDIELSDGLMVSGGTTGAWLVTFKVIR